MRYGKPILQSSYKRLYDPMRGRRVLEEHKGFFKNTARNLGLSGLLGIDPRHEAGFLINRPINAYYEGASYLSNFLEHYKGATKDEIKLVRNNLGKISVKIGGAVGSEHHVIKRGKDYLIKTHNQNLWQSSLPLRIVANNDQEMIEKLVAVFNSPVARAKLVLKKPVLPHLNTDLYKFGYQNYVMLNDSKIVPNSYPQEFEANDAYSIGNEFDSALGGVAASQVNYHLSDNYTGPYSEKPADKPFETVHDEAWIRINAMTEHLLSSTVTDGLLGNIVNMYDTQGRMSPEQRSQTIEKLREDYIYNLHGKGTTNTRKRDESPASFAYDITKDSLWKQFELANNPLRGGRIWREPPFSLEQTVQVFYKSSADGKRILKYDINPKKFKELIKKEMCIKPIDRQFMASYGRKILGAYVGLKFLADEIAKINLNDPTVTTEQQSYNQQKWADLNHMQDMLFESTGDLRDYLRLCVGGFGQLKQTVSTNIPKLVENKTLPHLKNISDDKKNFVNQTKKNLLTHIKNYTYLEDLWGWHARERVGSWIYKDIIEKVYDKPVPKVRGATAAIVLLEGIDNLSRELKYVETTFQAAANGKTSFLTMLEKIKKGDIKGVNSFIKWNMNRLVNGLTEERNFPEYRNQALEAEGIMMEDDYLSPPKQTYLGENQGFFFGNPPTSRSSWLYADVIKKDMVEFMQLCGIHIKKIQSEMTQKNVKDIYKTQAMKRLEDLLRNSADAMSHDYMDEKKNLFQDLKSDEVQKLHYEISKKMYHFLKTAVNVSGLLANAPDVVYR